MRTKMKFIAYRKELKKFIKTLEIPFKINTY